MYEERYFVPVIRGEEPPFQLPAWIACAPFEEYLGMTIEEAADGRALLTMPFQVRHTQGKGLMHGGAITSLADTAVAMAIKSLLPEGSHFVTIDLTLRFHAAITGGSIRAEARTEWQNERTIEGIAEIYDEQGIKAATFTSRFRVLSRP